MAHHTENLPMLCLKKGKKIRPMPRKAHEFRDFRGYLNWSYTPCRRKLCIACDDFLCFPSKSRLALTPLPFPFASDPLCWAPPRGSGRQISFLHAPAGNPCNLSVTGFFLLSVDHFLFGCIPPCGSDYAIWAGQPAYLRKSFLPPLQTRRRLL